MRDPLPIEPFDSPIDATVVVPGSKSYTNRAHHFGRADQ
jgi:5-enolpyruvylshikimate-3-phosphate synthase